VSASAAQFVKDSPLGSAGPFFSARWPAGAGPGPPCVSDLFCLMVLLSFHRLFLRSAETSRDRLDRRAFSRQGLLIGRWPGLFLGADYRDTVALFHFPLYFPLNRPPCFSFFLLCSYALLSCGRGPSQPGSPSFPLVFLSVRFFERSHSPFPPAFHGRRPSLRTVE